MIHLIDLINTIDILFRSSITNTSTCLILQLPISVINVQLFYNRKKITTPAVTIHRYLPSYLHHNCTTYYYGGTQSLFIF